MSTPLDDVLTPSMLFNEVDPDALDLPASGTQRLVVDQADSLLKLLDSGGNKTPVGGGIVTAATPRVRVATTVDITIATALNNGDTLDGVTLATGDRVLVKDQSA